MQNVQLSDMSKAALELSIDALRDDLYDTPECDQAIATLLCQWGQFSKADQLLDEMLLKWGSADEVLELTSKCRAQMMSMKANAKASEVLAKPTHRPAVAALAHAAA
ncbi:hypothetical protein [Halomonas dongshanensis]|uniref:Uncharacterized protein n=1 Tax=Halomonas dongshanensis TaxID=2890835 RepID=A0ABT2EG78_9GAMM|nr:hypothetical protein [Halomonas dongshanensis]MCS2609637.1 hypothetical protein [Halomonas dongshanensis]